METSWNDDSDFDTDEDERSGLAPGVNFMPGDRSLVAYFLRNKVLGKTNAVMDSFILEADVYASHPAAIPWPHHPRLTRSYHYYFSRRQKASPNGNGNRPKRTIDCGWWRSDTGDKDIVRRGKLVGHKKTLSFFQYKDQTKKRKEAQKTGWIMHEYRLPDDSFQEWVLCKIYNKPSKKKTFDTTDHSVPVCVTAMVQPELIGVQTEHAHSDTSTAITTTQKLEEIEFDQDFSDWLSAFLNDEEMPVEDVHSICLK